MTLLAAILALLAGVLGWATWRARGQTVETARKQEAVAVETAALAEKQAVAKADAKRDAAKNADAIDETNAWLAEQRRKK